MNGFTIELPEGFVALPATAAATEVTRAVETLFGLQSGDPSATAVARSLSTLGLIAAEGGAEYTSIGFFRSPDDPQRPVSMVLTVSRMPSDHDDPGAVVAGLREAFTSIAEGGAHILRLPAGHAVATVREEPAMIEIEDVDPIPVLQRQILAWIPDPHGTVVAELGVASNSWQDWAHICDVALDVFESLSWEDSDLVQTADSR